MYEHNWYQMSFNSDFANSLIKYGRLPIDTVDKQMQMVKKLAENEKTIKNLKVSDKE